MKNMTIQEFAMQTASNEPVPGGGSISARAEVFPPSQVLWRLL